MRHWPSLVTGRSLALLAIVSLGLGCKPATPTPAEATPPADAPPTADAPPADEPGVPQPEQPTAPVDGEPSASDRVDAIKQQLAEQLGVDASEIELVIAEDVQWNNGALGCPQPDMAYTQAIEPGYRVVLEHGGTQYSFHGRNRGEPFLCESPQR